MGLIREKMLTDMQIKNFSPHTQDAYVRYARKFVEHHMRPPTDLGEEDVTKFLRYLLEEKHVKPSSLRMYVVSIKFLYNVTLDRPWVVQRIPTPKVPKTLPDIPSGTEVTQILSAVRSIKHRAILTTLYAAGLRISEACSLCVTDIDSNRGLIHVRLGKLKKDRYVPLSRRLLLLLREYWKAVRPPKPYLFPGDKPGAPISRDAVGQALAKVVKRVGLTKHITPHTLRHAYATHLLELGTEVRVVQCLLGHSSPRSTNIYTHVTTDHVGRITSPLDLLGTRKGEILK
jgi:integrase/recombinase XerD